MFRFERNDVIYVRTVTGWRVFSTIEGGQVIAALMVITCRSVAV
jgi:hypothetical protein